MRRTAAIFFIVILVAFGNLKAETYYLSPTGDDANDGLSRLNAWATLQHASDMLSPGDTLLILGGDYMNAQGMWTPNSGTENNPIVLRAYGDSKAYFKRASLSDGQFFRLDTTDWFVIDGTSYIDPNDDERYIVLQTGGFDGMAPNYAYAAIHCLGNADGGTSDHIKINKVEISGLYCGHNAAVGDDSYLYNGMYLSHCRYWEITDCHIHHIGDSTYTYGTGYGLMYRYSRFMRIEDCVLDHAGHGLIEHYYDNDYCIIRNNIVANNWGGGIYVYGRSNYNLFENNLIYYAGTAYGDNEGFIYPKAGVMLTASLNVFRNNVLYNPWNQGFNVLGLLRNTQAADSNLIYNNTIYHNKWGYGNLMVQAVNVGVSVSNNLIANNIIYKSWGWGGGTACMSVEDPYASPEVLVHNEGGVVENNVFKNNLIRKWASTSVYDTLVVVNPGCNRYNLEEIEAFDPQHWYDNISDRPMLISEDPDGFGLYSDWWHLRDDSPCIDRGAFVDDWIGAYVESRYPGYGWGNRSYSGARPDIGAHEYSLETTWPLPPPVRIEHTAK